MPTPREPKKRAAADKSDKGDKEEKVARKATTMYLEPAILGEFKKRVVDEPKHGYEIVEEMIKGYLEIRPEIVAALWKVREKNKKALYKAVEDALVAHLQTLELL